jgi:uncharacterized protein involved in tolerance to divalent cations
MKTVFVNIPCPTKKEAKKLCGELLAKKLCGTAKIFEKTSLMWFEKNKVQEDEVVVMVLKTANQNVPKIHEFIFKNHSWGTPCIEVVPLENDLC